MPEYSHLHEELRSVVEQVYQFLGEMSIVWNCRVHPKLFVRSSKTKEFK